MLEVFYNLFFQHTTHLYLSLIHIVNKYVNVITIAHVVDKLPAAAIMYGSFPIHAYTNVIESTQFRNCSSVCDTLVGFIFCCPEKYPLYTADIATNSIAGDRTFITYATSGTFKIFVAIKMCIRDRYLLT